LPGKEDTAKSRPNPRHPLFSSLTSVRDDDTVDEMETPVYQHDESHKPEEPPASSKPPKKMRLISRQSHRKNGPAECPDVSLTRMGNVRFARPAALSSPLQ
jgi:hypothetical protein